jgi:hypothetical protein
MSFGFSVGDFITAGELAFRVYQNVYLVAKNAPDAITKLRDELASLVGAINILQAEVETPNSIINNAGDTRKAMVKDIIHKILNTLQELEQLSGRYAVMNNEEGSKPRQIWARLKWAKEVPSVTTLLAKVSMSLMSSSVLLLLKVGLLIG